MLKFDKIKTISQLYARALGGIEACAVRGDLDGIREILGEMNKREEELNKKEKNK